jgi:hypothetical protein
MTSSPALSDNLVERVLNNPLGAKAHQLGDDSSHFLFREDALDGDPVLICTDAISSIFAILWAA